MKAYTSNGETPSFFPPLIPKKMATKIYAFPDPMRLVATLGKLTSSGGKSLQTPLIRGFPREYLSESKVIPYKSPGSDYEHFHHIANSTLYYGWTVTYHTLTLGIGLGPGREWRPGDHICSLASEFRQDLFCICL